jgi:hypothetical protein
MTNEESVIPPEVAGNALCGLPDLGTKIPHLPREWGNKEPKGHIDRVGKIIYQR